MNKHFVQIALRVLFLIPLYQATVQVVGDVGQALLLGFVAAPVIGGFADLLTDYYFSE